MEVINFFDSGRQNYWLEEIKRSDWGAGAFLHKLISNGTFVYTFPEHRCHRYMGLLFEEIERLAKEEHISEVYISTDHIGLYEKYGCEYRTQMNDMNGELSRISVKKIQ